MLFYQFQHGDDHKLEASCGVYDSNFETQGQTWMDCEYNDVVNYTVGIRGFTNMWWPHGGKVVTILELSRWIWKFFKGLMVVCVIVIAQSMHV